MSQEYPLPRFQFQVSWEGKKGSFTEVTGLVMEREKIEYRHSDSKDLQKISMPGLFKSNNITLKRGTFANDTDFFKWWSQIAEGRTKGRRNVTIELQNENGEPVAVWRVLNCFPVKITAPDLKSDANEVAIESIEIAHEGLELQE